MRAIEITSISPKLFIPVKSERLELLELAYTVFSEAKIIKSQGEFSRTVLRMKPSYYSCMRARNRSPNTYIFERILHVARFYHRGIELNKHFNKPHAVSLNKAHTRLEALINTIEEALFLQT